MSYTERITYIQKYLSNEMLEGEKSDFEKWKTESDENKLAYQQIKTIWDAAEPNDLPTFDSERAYKKHLFLLENENKPSLRNDHPTSKNIIRFNFVKYWHSIAAVLIVFVVAIYFLRIDEGQVYQASANQKVALQDGSEVYLENGSQLTFQDKEFTREAVLKGKGFFIVAKNKNKPFNVKMDGLLVAVLGTEFLLDENTKSVFVKAGTVEVKDKSQKVVLKHNQRLVLTDNGELEVEDRIFSATDVWFNEALVFDNVPFDRVVEDLKNKFSVNILLPSNRDWSSCTFTSGSLKDNKLDEILTILKLTYELEYEKIDEKTIKLSKVKCR